MLHLDTVSSTLLNIIRTVSGREELTGFRLVGGTALSLYLGHRISVDADFFTDRGFDKRVVEQTLLTAFPGIRKIQEAAYGFTWVHQDVKLDFYDWKVPFLQAPTEEDGMRLASLADVAAYKLDAVVGRKTEKDFRDVAQLLQSFTLTEMMGFYTAKFPYNDPRIVLDHLTLAGRVGRDPELVLLSEKLWPDVVNEITEALRSYFEELHQRKQADVLAREQRLNELLSRKNKPPSG